MALVYPVASAKCSTSTVGRHVLVQVLRCSFVVECEGRAGSNFWANVIAPSALYDLAPSFFDSLPKACPIERAGRVGHDGKYFTRIFC